MLASKSLKKISSKLEFSIYAVITNHSATRFIAKRIEEDEAAKKSLENRILEISFSS